MRPRKPQIECFDFPLGYLCRSLIEFASFICVCVIVGLSRKNPFEKHIIGNLTNYFNDVIDTPISNETKYNNSILIYDKKTKNIFNESCKDYSDDDIDDIEKIKIFGKLRKLVCESFCLEIRENFQKFKGKKLSTIFDLKYSKIHKFAISEMVISCVMFLSMIIGGYATKADNECLDFFTLISILLLIPRFALSFLLFYYMEKSDIERYDDFLDCKNVRVKTFKKIAGITRLRNCFYTFVIFNVVILGIEKLERLVEYSEEFEENVKNRLNKNQY